MREGRRQLTLDVDSAPTSVRLDPELRLWRALAPNQLPPILRQWITAASPRLVIAQAPGQGAAPDEIGTAAPALVQRLFERAAQPSSLEVLDQGSGPMLLIGGHAAVDAALARAGLPPRPASLGMRGSAQVWTVIRAQGAPLAVVSARDAGALQDLSRPLPHYGAQSWLVFEGRRALERGVWELRDDGVAVRRIDRALNPRALPRWHRRAGDGMRGTCSNCHRHPVAGTQHQAIALAQCLITSCAVAAGASSVRQGPVIDHCGR